MRLNHFASICLSFVFLCQFSACSKSKGGAAQPAVLSGGPACSKVTTAINSHRSILEKDVVVVQANQEEMDKITQLVANLEKISTDHTANEDYDCVIKGVDGQEYDYGRQDLLETIVDLKATFGI